MSGSNVLLFVTTSQHNTKTLRILICVVSLSKYSYHLISLRTSRLRLKVCVKSMGVWGGVGGGGGGNKGYKLSSLACLVLVFNLVFVVNVDFESMVRMENYVFCNHAEL